MESNDTDFGREYQKAFEISLKFPRNFLHRGRRANILPAPTRSWPGLALGFLILLMGDLT
jgi:hypothetical protein